jgi:hypothetical protein
MKGLIIRATKHNGWQIRDAQQQRRNDFRTGAAVLQTTVSWLSPCRFESLDEVDARIDATVFNIVGTTNNREGGYQVKDVAIAAIDTLGRCDHN